MKMHHKDMNKSFFFRLLLFSGRINMTILLKIMEKMMLR